MFELSKCDQVAIRIRMVAGLRNIDEDLARSVADGLGLSELPAALPPARDPIRDRPASPALSILRNGPESFGGRKISVLVTDGIDAATLEDLRSAAGQQHVNVELIAPTVGGIDAGNGARLPADQKFDGGPSVLYDAVVVLVPKHGATELALIPAARDFITDAHAHCKFIGHAGDAAPLFEAPRLSNLIDDGFINLDEHSAADFITRCGQLRYWPRQASMTESAYGKAPARLLALRHAQDPGGTL